MLVKIWLYLTKAVITGDVDEVRVQSEEPNLKSLLLSRLFAFRVPPGRHPASRLNFFHRYKLPCAAVALIFTGMPERRCRVCSACEGLTPGP